MNKSEYSHNLSAKEITNTLTACIQSNSHYLFITYYENILDKNAVKDIIEKNMDVKFFTIDASNINIVAKISSEEKKLKDITKYIISIEGLDVLSVEQRQSFYKAINLGRDYFLNDLTHTVMFWVPLGFAREILEQTPDFWSRVMSTFTIKSDQKRILQDQILFDSTSMYDFANVDEKLIIRSLSRLDQKNPKDIPDIVHYTLSLIFSKIKQGGKSYEAKEIDKIFDLIIKIKDSAKHATAMLKLGIILENLTQYDLALKTYKHALEAFIKLGDSNGISKSHTNIGNIQSELKQYQESIESYNRALETKFDNNEARYGKGQVLSNMGKNDEALASYNKALEINPNDYRALNSKGNALESLGKNDEALASYNKALEINPNEPILLMSKGNALFNIGKYNDALVLYDSILNIKSNFHEAIFAKGAALESLGKNDEALASYNKALEINPNDYRIWTNKGNILMHLGKYDKAIEHHDRALEINPNDYRAWNNKAWTLKELNRYDEAIKCFEMALQINPNYDIGKQNLQTVRKLLKKK